MNGDNNNLPGNIKWPAIVSNLKNKKLVPFLGAGASIGFEGKEGLPAAGGLACQLAKICDYPDKSCDDLFKICQYYKFQFEEQPLRDKVTEILSDPKFVPSGIHHIIASWPIEYVLTTNFDDLMEEAFRDFKSDEGLRKKPFEKIYHKSGNQEEIDIEPSIEHPLVYKFHGSYKDELSMILTEDDVIEFLTCLIEGNPKIPDKIKLLIQDKSIMFIGYGLKDWNIRVLLNHLRTKKIRSFSVQWNANIDTNDVLAKEWESIVGYWDDHQIDVYNCDALAFLRELNKKYLEEQ